MFAKRFLVTTRATPLVLYTAEDKRGVIRMSTLWACMAAVASFAMIYKKKVLEPQQAAERRLRNGGYDDKEDEEDAAFPAKRNLAQDFARAGITYMYVPILMASSLLLVTNFFHARSRVSELTRLGDRIAVRTFDMRGNRSAAHTFALRDMRIEEETAEELVVVPVLEASTIPMKFRFDLPCNEVKKLFQGGEAYVNRTIKLASNVGATSQAETIEFEKSLRRRRHNKV